MPAVAKMFAAMIRKLEPIVRDHGIPITYFQYTGVGTDDEGNPQDEFYSFTISVLRGSSGGWTTTPEGKIRVQSSRVTLIGLEKHLPDGITLDDLGNNDKIEFSGQRYDVSNYRPVHGLSFRFEIEGG